MMIPVLAAAGAILLYNLSPALSAVNSNVRMAREIRLEKEKGVQAVSKWKKRAY
jgi:hypothetical protein